MPGAGRVRLAEAVEDVGQEILADALPGIPHSDLDVGIISLQRYLDPSSAGRELHRIGNNVPNDLLEAAKVQKPTTREWFATARNYALYSNQGGAYDEIISYLKAYKII